MMTAVLRSQDNLHFLKLSLRKRLRLVRSSHLTEAVAAAMGCNTYAALLAELRQASSTQPDIARVDDARFLSRLRDFEYPVGEDRILSDIVRSPELPEPIWREFKGRDIPAMNVWYRECQRRDIPYVFITTRRKYAKVEWDCIALDKRHDDRTRGEDSSQLVHSMFDSFQRLASSKKALFFGSAFVGQIDNLTPEAARSTADEMFVLLYSAVCGKAPGNEPSFAAAR